MIEESGLNLEPQANPGVLTDVVYAVVNTNGGDWPCYPRPQSPTKPTTFVYYEGDMEAELETG
jgi:hypothetical protein